jgi:hypothetical protein
LVVSLSFPLIIYLCLSHVFRFWYGSPVDGAEAQDLGFGPAGGGAAEALGLLERIASPTFE